MAIAKKNTIPCICLPYQGFECIYCEIPDDAFLDTCECVTNQCTIH